MNHTQRLALYNQGMNDREIGDIEGCSLQAIFAWRSRNGLPAHNRTNTRPHKECVPMESALNPDQCQTMRQFFADLLMAAEHGRVDVGKFMTIYRDSRLIEKGA